MWAGLTGCEPGVGPRIVLSPWESTAFGKGFAYCGSLKGKLRQKGIAMKHLVTTFAHLPLSESRHRLIEAHDFLVARCLNAVDTMPKMGPLWGIQTKRLRPR